MKDGNRIVIGYGTPAGNFEEEFEKLNKGKPVILWGHTPDVEPIGHFNGWSHLPQTPIDWGLWTCHMPGDPAALNCPTCPNPNSIDVEGKVVRDEPEPRALPNPERKKP